MPTRGQYWIFCLFMLIVASLVWEQGERIQEIRSENIALKRQIDDVKSHAKLLGVASVSKDIQIQELHSLYGGLRRDLYQGWMVRK